MSSTDKCSSKTTFLNLQSTDFDCVGVDTEFGKFYVCRYCGVIKVRERGSFTMENWNSHTKTRKHQDKRSSWKELNCEIRKKREQGMELQSGNYGLNMIQRELHHLLHLLVLES